jgi:hydrogenase expression/formation protein HypE
VGSTLNEIAAAAGIGIRIYEDRLPVKKAVAGVCELLGFDPLYVANEGKLLAFVPQKHAQAVLATMRAHPLGKEAAVIGECIADHPGRVVMETAIGGTRIVDMLAGEQLPRIC